MERYTFLRLFLAHLIVQVAPAYSQGSSSTVTAVSYSSTVPNDLNKDLQDEGKSSSWYAETSTSTSEAYDQESSVVNLPSSETNDYEAGPGVNTNILTTAESGQTSNEPNTNDLIRTTSLAQSHQTNKVQTVITGTSASASYSRSSPAWPTSSSKPLANSHSSLVTGDMITAKLVTDEESHTRGESSHTSSRTLHTIGFTTEPSTTRQIIQSSTVAIRTVSKPKERGSRMYTTNKSVDAGHAQNTDHHESTFSPTMRTTVSEGSRKFTNKDTTHSVNTKSSTSSTSTKFRGSTATHKSTSVSSTSPKSASFSKSNKFNFSTSENKISFTTPQTTDQKLSSKINQESTLPPKTRSTKYTSKSPKASTQISSKSTLSTQTKSTSLNKNINHTLTTPSFNSNSKYPTFSSGTESSETRHKSTSSLNPRPTLTTPPHKDKKSTTLVSTSPKPRSPKFSKSTTTSSVTGTRKPSSNEYNHASEQNFTTANPFSTSSSPIKFNTFNEEPTASIQFDSKRRTTLESFANSNNTEEMSPFSEDPSFTHEKHFNFTTSGIGTNNSSAEDGIESGTHRNTIAKEESNYIYQNKTSDYHHKHTLNNDEESLYSDRSVSLNMSSHTNNFNLSQFLSCARLSGDILFDSSVNDKYNSIFPFPYTIRKKIPVDEKLMGSCSSWNTVSFEFKFNGENINGKLVPTGNIEYTAVLKFEIDKSDNELYVIKGTQLQLNAFSNMQFTRVHSAIMLICDPEACINEIHHYMRMRVVKFNLKLEIFNGEEYSNVLVYKIKNGDLLRAPSEDANYGNNSSTTNIIVFTIFFICGFAIIVTMFAFIVHRHKRREGYQSLE